MIFTLKQTMEMRIGHAGFSQYTRWGYGSNSGVCYQQGREIADRTWRFITRKGEGRWAMEGFHQKGRL